MSGTNFQKIGYNISPDFRRMHLLPKLFLLFCLCIPLINEPAHSQDRQSDSVTISYKGNMGVFISSGKLDVLIDGLHDFYRPDYLNTPVAELQKMVVPVLNKTVLNTSTQSSSGIKGLPGLSFKSYSFSFLPFLLFYFFVQ